MKSSEKHTPGPWQVGHFNENMICDCDGEVRGCGPIAYVEGTAAEKKANARLIAAAPDLLDALQGMIEWAELMGTDERNSRLAAARAAIAKATEGKA